MVVVRLSRGGAKKRPFFNIVVTDKRNRRDGSFIERLGFYNPAASEKEKQSLRVDLARVEHWKSQGAQVSPTVARLVRDFSKANVNDVAATTATATATATETTTASPTATQPG